MQAESGWSTLFGAQKRVLFVVLCISAILLLYIKKQFIEYETSAVEFLQDRPEGGILRLISTLQFISIPLIYAWKFTVIGFVLWIGCFMFGFRITYWQCWGVALAAEYVFLLPELIKIGWFLFVTNDPTLPEIRAFYPLSLMNLVNVFEIPYVYLLVTGLFYFAQKQKKMMWWIVTTSYVLIFSLWLLFYMIVYK
jgi:hypothetical protein